MDPKDGEKCEPMTDYIRSLLEPSLHLEQECPTRRSFLASCETAIHLADEASP
jgi:hypothetical protein